MIRSGQATMLLVEDNPNDVLFFRRALAKAQVSNPVQVARDGAEAIDYLNGTGPYADRMLYPLPWVILLDLKMPRRNGFDVLRWLRQQPRIKRLPVVVFTSSNDLQDVEQAYDLGANSYLLKPVRHDELLEMVRLISAYWLATNEILGL